MKIRTITALMLAGMLSLSSCVNNGDIDELQDQINDLNSTVENIQKTQQEALLAAIASLEADLVTLENELGSDINELGTDYHALLADLGVLEEEVEGNANAVFYGNVITEADYTALTTQGATIITGKVVITGDAHVLALANIKLIGKSLEVKGGSTITMDALQSIGEDLMVMSVGANASINLAKLSSVGGDVEIMNNTGLTSFMANELALISGGLSSEKNVALTTISLAKLDQVYEVNINEYLVDDPEYLNIGALAMLDLSSANVTKSVEISYVGAVENLALGSVGGNLICEYSKVKKITLDGTSLGGDFVIENNLSISNIDVPNLSRIEGKLRIYYNYDWNTAGSGLVTMPSFAALTYIGGDVYISNNSNLITAEAFNNVTEVRGENIEFSYNGNLENVSIFNALVDTNNPASQWGDNSHADITVQANTFWFDGFNSLVEITNLNVSVSKTSGVFDETTGMFEPGGDTAKLEGFDALTDVSSLNLTVTEATDFNAFASLNNFKNYQTYLTVAMPSDTNVGLCTMEPIFTRIKNGDFENWNNTRIPVFKYNWSEMDRDTAIDQLLAPCGV
ncbi:hypothetical protein SAMN06265371_11039 [Lutibacter agarilyticus]|uniref:Uncharacterized protein n=1 Tax=Lutibacter agarilyticus TaxID=1109740 RepID=A0A238YN83_9FLAO|nr:hypothetical protein [Lutibacter agarilyticus]SNR72607.1 hypothetical protein SAMN06265371_11039 [Lutibacter agarilyticus]